MDRKEGTVFLVDDDPSHLSAVQRLLEVKGYTVVCFDSAESFLAHRWEAVPACAVVDVRMPGLSGLELQEALAESEGAPTLVFLTGHGDMRTGVQAMREGAEDFLSKTAPSKDLFAAIDRALDRNKLEHKRRVRQRELQAKFEQLTLRESVVLEHVLEGKLNKEIAVDLRMTERSVKRHRTNMMRKLGISSVAELARLAVEVGITPSDWEGISRSE